MLGTAAVVAILRQSAGVTTILGDGKRLGFLLWVILGSTAVPGSLITLCLVSRSLRAHFRAVDGILKQLETFSVKEHTVAHCCTLNHIDPDTGTTMTCDRIILEQCLEMWFGSVQAFNEFIQNELSLVFKKLTTSTVPYTWIVAAGIPLLWFMPGLQPIICGQRITRPQKGLYSTFHPGGWRSAQHTSNFLSVSFPVFGDSSKVFARRCWSISDAPCTPRSFTSPLLPLKVSGIPRLERMCPRWQHFRCL